MKDGLDCWQDKGAVSKYLYYTVRESLLPTCRIEATLLVEYVDVPTSVQYCMR
jgi:hypothetical protein